MKCIQCKKEFKISPAFIKRGRKCCSKECWNIYKRKLSKFIICAWCNKSFENIWSQRTKRFCSKKCYTKSMKGKPAYPNLVGKRGVKPRTYHLRKRPLHAGVEYTEWRTAVFKRDKYTCVLCKQVGGRLEADHIKPYAKYPELRLELSNGRTLCKDCHKKTDSYGWQNYWKNHRRR